jgi:hypothetical protein
VQFPATPTKKENKNLKKASQISIGAGEGYRRVHIRLLTVVRLVVGDRGWLKLQMGIITIVNKDNILFYVLYIP